MIVTKDLRVDVLGEPLFQNVNLVIRSGERVALLGPTASATLLLLQVLSGDEEEDEGKVLTEGERISYITTESLRTNPDSLVTLFHTRPTFLFVHTAEMSGEELASVSGVLRDFKGGALIASDSASLMQIGKVTRVLEIRDFTKSITSFTGTYDAYLVEREKDLARITEAYERQQREKQKLEDWLEQKREAAAKNRSPQNGNTIRTKKKFLEREILRKEIPKPPEVEDQSDVSS